MSKNSPKNVSKLAKKIIQHDAELLSIKQKIQKFFITLVLTQHRKKVNEIKEHRQNLKQTLTKLIH